MQGDLYRAKQKERMRSERPDYSGILIAVDDMCINDMDNCDRCNDDDDFDKGGYRNQIRYGDEVGVMAGAPVPVDSHVIEWASLTKRGE